MPLYALTDADEIAAAYQQFANRLQENATSYERQAGWQGGGGKYLIHWNPTIKLWGLADDTLADQYWFGFGIDDPTDKAMVGNIVVQFGFVREGANRQRAGVFARNEHGTLFLAHSGKIGGGRPGIGRNAFLDFYDGQFVNINWRKPKAAKVEYILIDSLESPDLMERVSKFARSVEQFKESVTAPK